LEEGCFEWEIEDWNQVSSMEEIESPKFKINGFEW